MHAGQQRGADQGVADAGAPGGRRAGPRWPAATPPPAAAPWPAPPPAGSATGPGPDWAARSASKTARCSGSIRSPSATTRSPRRTVTPTGLTRAAASARRRSVSAWLWTRVGRTDSEARWSRVARSAGGRPASRAPAGGRHLLPRRGHGADQRQVGEHPLPGQPARADGPDQQAGLAVVGEQGLVLDHQPAEPLARQARPAPARPARRSGPPPAALKSASRTSSWRRATKASRWAA